MSFAQIRSFLKSLSDYEFLSSLELVNFYDKKMSVKPKFWNVLLGVFKNFIHNKKAVGQLGSRIKEVYWQRLASVGHNAFVDFFRRKIHVGIKRFFNKLHKFCNLPEKKQVIDEQIPNVVTFEVDSDDDQDEYQESDRSEDDHQPSNNELSEDEESSIEEEVSSQDRDLDNVEQVDSPIEDDVEVDDSSEWEDETEKERELRLSEFVVPLSAALASGIEIKGNPVIQPVLDRMVTELDDDDFQQVITLAQRMAESPVHSAWKVTNQQGREGDTFNLANRYGIGEEQEMLKYVGDVD